MSNFDVSKSVWDSTIARAENLHKQCGRATDRILIDAIRRRTTDNVTAILIAFKNFQEELFPHHCPKDLGVTVVEPDNDAMNDKSQAMNDKTHAMDDKINQNYHYISKQADTRDSLQVFAKHEEGYQKKLSETQEIKQTTTNNTPEELAFKNPFRYKLQKIIRPNIPNNK